MINITHKEYVASPYWKRFSKKLLDDPDVCCAMCKRPKWAIYKINTKKHKKGDKRRLIVLNLHHINYEELGQEKDHVLALCRRCHMLAHDIERAGRTESFWSTVYLSLINNSDWEFTPCEIYEVPDDFILSKKRKSKDKIRSE